MRKKIFITFFCIILAFIGNGQCKVKSKGAIIKYLKKHTGLDIVVHTKPKVLFDKYFVAAINYFAKASDDNYYFFMPFNRSYSSKIEANEETPLVFYLDSGEEVIIRPYDHIEGKMNLTTLSALLTYNITREEITKLASGNLVSVNFYFLAEKEISNTFEDDRGRYFEFDIHSEKFKYNVMNAANCILQH